MYVTRRLSLYRKFPDSLSLPPPEGPNSGYLVVQDEESETTTCFGLCREGNIRDLPFPQNKKLMIDANDSYYEVILIPALNQPLSSNQYYAIVPHGKHKGEAYTNSKEEDMGTSCLGKYVRDVKPRPLDTHNPYQQVEISPHEGTCSHRGEFLAKSVAPDGFASDFLRAKGWRISTLTTHNYELGEAPGLDGPLRARLPEFNFPLYNKSSEIVVVGKWYCPFMFIREGTLRDQVKRSMYYEMTLEQKWEQIFECENNHGKDNSVVVDVVVQREAALVAGSEAVYNEQNVADGVMWFRSFESVGEEVNIGLSLAIVERMKWEEERAGWVGGKDRQVRVERVEEFGGLGGWRKFGCYVLVERFVLKRMDRSLVLSYDFNHTHQIRSKWE